MVEQVGPVVGKPGRRRVEPTDTVGTVYRGHVFHVAGTATLATAAASLVSLPDGALALDANGRIAWVGSAPDLPAAWRGARTVRADFLLPGFVDTHLHFPQTYATQAFGGGPLLTWLDRCIFPAEARLADDAFAAQTARDFVARRIAVGSTSAMVVGSAFPAAQDALFAATSEAGLRMVSGRGVQTTGPTSAAPLITDEKTAIELVEAEIDRWHGCDGPGPGGNPAADPARALLQVAVIPRFSLSVTRRTLAALGELYTAHRSRGVYFHSHLSENAWPDGGEIGAVQAAYGVRSYLDTYDGRFRPGSKVGGPTLLGPRSVLAHAVHCTDAELARMAETGTSIAHCPTSQQFLGSGTMPWRRTSNAGVLVAAGTDVGAGDAWLIPQVLNDAYKVHLSEPGPAGVALHPAELLYTGTLAGAQALDQGDEFGNFDVGKAADLVLVDAAGWPPLERRLAAGSWPDDPVERDVAILFTLLLGMQEPAVRGVVVNGRELGAVRLS